jgi:hypothetical protein
MDMNEYQRQVVGDGGHSMNSSRPCHACGDMDGCHVPARLRREQEKAEQSVAPSTTDNAQADRKT